VGKFVIFEGINGCGKTSIIKELKSRVEGAIDWKFPSMGVVGQLLRHHLTGTTPALPSSALLPLFLSDILMDVPRLETSKATHDILCDRYAISTLVYQQDEGWTIHELAQIFQLVGARLPEPDAIVFLDVEPEVAYERCMKRGDPRATPPTVDRLTIYQERYRQILDALSATIGDKIIAVDNTASVEETADVIVKRLGW
jgi:dTMP kinase